MVIKKEGEIKYSIIITHTHTHRHDRNSETNEINHPLGVSVCWFLCTSFLRQPTAKLDYVFSFSSILLLTRSSFAFQNNTTTKKKGKNLQGRKRRFSFHNNNHFHLAPPLFHSVFHVLYLALLPSNTFGR